MPKMTTGFAAIVCFTNSIEEKNEESGRWHAQLTTIDRLFFDRRLEKGVSVIEIDSSFKANSLIPVSKQTHHYKRPFLCR